MPTIEEMLEIASRHPTSMADALLAACVEKALGDGDIDSEEHQDSNVKVAVSWP